MSGYFSEVEQEMAARRAEIGLPFNAGAIATWIANQRDVVAELTAERDRAQEVADSLDASDEVSHLEDENFELATSVDTLKAVVQCLKEAIRQDPGSQRLLATASDMLDDMPILGVCDTDLVRAYLEGAVCVTLSGDIVPLSVQEFLYLNTSVAHRRRVTVYRNVLHHPEHGAAPWLLCYSLDMPLVTVEHCHAADPA
ncbi:hypothetical protein [Metallibacterium scheffleri]|uniref:Uncharacterized protein n=1 Tax=Metallibacterium scheffleri TaxID=993689 RepID=A0A4S3KQX0_9GAMM|nr:hypothetical protein [Metallibacterium scheffleri]THD11340.1 hypothetical protein B1806_04265 [Metallibacterium scheffleri]